MSNDPDVPNATGSRGYSSIGGANTSINIQGLTQTTTQVNAFTTALSGLQTMLTKMAQTLPAMASTVSSGIGKVGAAAAPTSMGGAGGAGNIASAMFGSINERGWARDMLMFPTRFMRSNVLDNRQLALQASAGLSQQAFASGVDTKNMMGALAGQFGNVLGGSPADLVDLQRIASRVGAGIDWRNGLNVGAGSATGGPRAAGFFRSVFEAQRMNPGESVGNLATQIGQYAGNTTSQQQAAFLTGGAFAMIGAGNKQKSISEWATGILKWLQNLRAGSQRGRPFTYAELMSQNFPGSNIDAWLNANGVTEDMKQYFWTYALAQANPGLSSTDELFSKNAAVSSSVAFNRLQASAAQTRSGFRLAGTMAGAYSNKEQANQFFSELTGHLLNQVLPSAMSTGALSYMQFMPDTIEEIMMQLAERTGLGAIGAGVAGWGSGFQNLMAPGTGDVGDVGDFGSMGANSSAGLHPDMRKRVDAMMSANPRLKVTSGYRDLGTQQRLKRQGVGRVSGRPSAHTRGMAADMGPRSEYGWLSRNARKFGLSSGRRQGEPWHVGMGDVGDAASDIKAKLESAQGMLAKTDLMGMQFGGVLSDVFGSLFGAMTGSGSAEQQIKAIGGTSSILMQALMGIFGGEADLGRLKFLEDPSTYDQLVKAANEAKGPPTGVDGGGGGWWGNVMRKARDAVTGASSGGGTGGGPEGFASIPGGGATVGGVAGTLSGFFASVLQSLGAPVTQLNLDKLGAVAKQEGYRPGAYNPFNYVVGKQFPAHNSVGVRNYPDAATGIEYTTKLLNQNNTAAMRANLMSDASYADWINATSNFYGSWGGGRINISQPKANEYLSRPLGDMDDSGYYPSPAPMAAPRAAPVVFQNHFQIDGGGGANGGGIDVRRTVTLVADQLEQEMNRRMARRN